MERLRIERLGADGDGVARLPDGTTVFVPLSLPGELVCGTPEPVPGRNVWRARAGEVATPSPERVAPPCPHFGACGGCVLQHWSAPAQAAWKSSLVAHALQRAGFDGVALAPAQQTPPRARRRMDLALVRAGAGITVGLHARNAGRVVDLVSCDVLAPALAALIPALRRTLSGVTALRRSGSAVANLLDHGADVLLRLDAEPGVAERARLIELATAQCLVRLSAAVGAGAPEPLCVLRPPVATFGGIAVAVPPGAFLQASAAGEAAIVDAVSAGLPETLPRRAWIADLYAGCGTLTFPLARRARVSAYEGDAAAAAALRQAANAAGLGGRVDVAQRDLARRPLLPPELAGCAVAVLDPPHAGAAPQVAQLVAAAVPRIVYVSCNPQALGRDAASLRAAGYRLLRATAIDQFLWSARVESVCIFAR